MHGVIGSKDLHTFSLNKQTSRTCSTWQLPSSTMLGFIYFFTCFNSCCHIDPDQGTSKLTHCLSCFWLWNKSSVIKLFSHTVNLGTHNASNSTQRTYHLLRSKCLWSDRLSEHFLLHYLCQTYVHITSPPVSQNYWELLWRYDWMIYFFFFNHATYVFTWSAYIVLDIISDIV